MDIPLVFGNLMADGSITGDGPGARAVSDRMSRAFIALARNGAPGHEGMPSWEPFTLPRRPTMIFDALTRMEDDPRGAERLIFARVPTCSPEPERACHAPLPGPRVATHGNRHHGAVPCHIPGGPAAAGHAAGLALDPPALRWIAQPTFNGPVPASVL
jgi:hypothetical protein